MERLGLKTLYAIKYSEGKISKEIIPDEYMDDVMTIVDERQALAATKEEETDND